MDAAFAGPLINVPDDVDHGDPEPIVLPGAWDVRAAILEHELHAIRHPAESRWWSMDHAERLAAAYAAAEFRVGLR